MFLMKINQGFTTNKNNNNKKQQHKYMVNIGKPCKLTKVLLQTNKQIHG